MDKSARRKPKKQKNYLKKRFFIFATLALILVVGSYFSECLCPYDPYEQNLSIVKASPSLAHPFGTDRYGRDMLSRVILGAQTTVFSALALVLIISVTGTILGMIGGYFGGKIDDLIMRISDLFLAFPGMVFAIAVAGVLSGGLKSAVIALACISWTKFARLARSQTLTVKEMPYIAAAKLSGCNGMQILLRHIFPNIAGTMIVTAMLDIGTMIMELAGLSFLGLGATPPMAEWGSMMSNGRSMLQTCPWIVIAPGIAMFVTVAIFNLLGDTVRDMI